MFGRCSAAGDLQEDAFSFLQDVVDVDRARHVVDVLGNLRETELVLRHQVCRQGNDKM